MPTVVWSGRHHDPRKNTGLLLRAFGQVAPRMPRDVAGSMPSNQMFPRLRQWATGLTPNPASKIEGAWHGVTPYRPEGNF